MQYKRFQQETRLDPDMQILRKYIETDWPLDKHAVPDSIKVYLTYKDELSVIDDIIYKDTRMVVPSKLRQEMLNRIHYNHLGIEKCKMRAREVLFWPGMSKQITDMVQNCEACLRFQRAQHKETYITRDIPHGPWQVIGVDLFHYAGSEYLLAVDYYSKYVEIAQLRDTSSKTVIIHLKSMFARLGIPLLIYSDNGPQFQNTHFRDFASKWNFNHKTSSPRYPQSNGLAERFVGTIKQMLKKCEYDGKDIYLALLEYRNTPISDKIPSPTELMFGRKIRGILPSTRNSKQNFKPDDIRHMLEERQNVYKKYYNKSAKDLNSFKTGDQVLIRKDTHNSLQPAEVVDICDRPRSYKLETSDGSSIERNRRHIYAAPRSQKPYLRNWELECNLSSQSEYNHAEKDKNYHYENALNEQMVSTTSPNVEHSSLVTADNSPSQRSTRPSRIIKPPSYLKDYVTY
ncbi:PREDICTED: uncharacterized protein K02A2.6-like [Wasmannia auropunctata]|uniref:uncharacterized protein K02A2.6-like n=1 Tax=Wasmannia auropunctata TaxID=64793 RepID=UPI0005EE41DB|nr:PREDICTED: uncharacterized protein K02A2.6-like [Wasmannia auropunctata]